MMRTFHYETEYFLEEVKPGSRGEDWTWNKEFHELTTSENHAAKTQWLIQDIKEHGMKEPVLIGDDNRCWDGHHRVVAAIHLGMSMIPCRYATDNVVRF